MNIGDYWTRRDEQPAPKGISELLASAGPEINDHVIALHREIADLREVLRTTQAIVEAQSGVATRLAAEFTRSTERQQNQVESLRAGKRALKARVRELEKGPGRADIEDRECPKCCHMTTVVASTNEWDCRECGAKNDNDVAKWPRQVVR